MALIDNLVAYYSLDEASGDAIDAHSTNDLTETGGTIAATTGIISGARDLEAGDAEYFLGADSAALSTGDIDFTISAWCNLESLANGVIVGKWETGGLRECLLFYNHNDHVTNARFTFGVSSNGTLNTLLDATTFGAPSTGTWYHVVGRHDSVNNILKINVNDVADSVSYSSGVFDSTAGFALGALFVGGVQFYGFDGLLDEIGFWKRYLSDAEVTDLYNAGAGRDYAYIASAGGNRRRRVLIGCAA